jgi:hypothetical protein
MGIDEEDLKKRAEALHKQNIALWDRFQQLNRRALAFQGDVDDFAMDVRKQGQKVYDLYITTGDMLKD